MTFLQLRRFSVIRRTLRGISGAFHFICLLVRVKVRVLYLLFTTCCLYKGETAIQANENKIMVLAGYGLILKLGFKRGRSDISRAHWPYYGIYLVGDEMVEGSRSCEIFGGMFTDCGM